MNATLNNPAGAVMATTFTSYEHPEVESYRRGALAIMEKHAPKRVEGLTKEEKAKLLADSMMTITPPPPYVPPRRKGDGSPESKAAFAEWLDVPEKERFKGLATAIAKRHGAVPMHVINRITRWKKENNK